MVRRQKLYDITYQAPRAVKFAEAERVRGLPRAEGRGMGSKYLLRTDFQFCKMKRAPERPAAVAVPQCECA